MVDVRSSPPASGPTASPICCAKLYGVERIASGDWSKTPNPLVGTYRTKDRRYVSLVMLESDRFWADLVTKMGRPELADDPRFVDSAARAAHTPECVAVLDEIFATRTLAEWKSDLGDTKGVWAPVQNASELLEDPQAVANGYVASVTAGSGDQFRAVAAPLQFDEQPPELGRSPGHGEHTDEVLAELGLDTDAILDLKVAGAVL